ncbi:hypothetical protein HanIR_Chr14g0726611 [Helianthus annuus]|nr:hypothetical protein HanIR_Chr17g0846341 [Helianthus annuus]KAJ0471156.1 hypothetical protein HanIR_Chr14g0726611 [Helianthus annuus]
MSVKTFSALAVVEWKAVFALETNPVEDATIFCKIGVTKMRACLEGKRVVWVCLFRPN